MIAAVHLYNSIKNIFVVTNSNILIPNFDLVDKVGVSCRCRVQGAGGVWYVGVGNKEKGKGDKALRFIYLLGNNLLASMYGRQ